MEIHFILDSKFEVPDSKHGAQSDHYIRVQQKLMLRKYGYNASFEVMVCRDAYHYSQYCNASSHHAKYRSASYAVKVCTAVRTIILNIASLLTPWSREEINSALVKLNLIAAIFHSETEMIVSSNRAATEQQQSSTEQQLSSS